MDLKSALKKRPTFAAAVSPSYSNDTERSTSKTKVRIDCKENELLLFNADRFVLHVAEAKVDRTPQGQKASEGKLSTKMYPARTRYVVYRNLLGHSVRHFGQPSVHLDLCIVTVELNKTASTAGRYFAPIFKYLLKRHMKKLQVEDALMRAAEDAQTNWNETFPECQDLCAYTVVLTDKQCSGRALVLNLGNLVIRRDTITSTGVHATAETLLLDKNLYGKEESLAKPMIPSQPKHMYTISRSAAENLCWTENTTNSKDLIHSIGGFGRTNFSAGPGRENLTRPSLYVIRNLVTCGLTIMNASMYSLLYDFNKTDNNIHDAALLQKLKVKMAKKNPRKARLLSNPFALYLKLEP